MRVLSNTIEAVGGTIVKLMTLIDLSDEPSEAQAIGEGPVGNAVPDRIVRYLIDHASGPDGASMPAIQQAVGGNPGTVNRQAWTLATNAPDLQQRLRGWVVSAGRGRYALSNEARGSLGRI